MTLVRDANPADFEQVLRLNAAFVNFLSPLTRERLARLHQESAYHRVVEKDGSVGAFLLAFREGCSYDSPNYRWFAERYDRFLYIDRIVVSQAHQGLGIGALLYADIFTFARRTQAHRVACEYDVDPPNEVSRRFHEGFGFSEVGTQFIASGRKKVSLQIAVPPPDVPSPAGNRVLASLQNAHGDYCVDVFVRPDGTFGFEEYRSDPEDCGRWHSLHRYSGRSFDSEEDALAHAKASIVWLKAT